MIKKVLFSAGLLAFMTSAYVMPVSATANKINVCHATGSVSNPFVLIEVDDNSIIKGNAHGSHHAEGDIIRPFVYTVKVQGKDVQKTYPGMNWNTVNETIYNNGCVFPSPTPGSDDNSNEKTDEPVKIAFCHVPQGNPANAHTITTSINGAEQKGHFVIDSEGNMQAKTGHGGDYLGECKSGEVDTPDDNKTPTQGEPGKGSMTPPAQNQGSTPVEVKETAAKETPRPVTASGVEALPYTAGDHTLAITLIAAGLAAIVTGLGIGVKALYRR